MATTLKAVLALDVGDKRVGIATASLEARLPRPLTTLNRGDDFLDLLAALVDREDAGLLVVGLPRGLDGQQTAQTASVEAFAQDLRRRFDLPIRFQDEAVTSRQAEAELEARGKPYQKADIDALAATYILEDFLNGQPEPAA